MFDDTDLPFDDPTSDAWPWELHEEPDRRIDSYARICVCDGCRDALRTQAVTWPTIPICLKTGADRILIDLATYVKASEQDDLQSLFYVDDDYLRDVFVPVGGEPFEDRPRWWSLSLHEDDVRAGRLEVVRRRPIRRSATDREAALEAARAEMARWPTPTPVVLAPVSQLVAGERARFETTLASTEAWADCSGRAVDVDLTVLLFAAMDEGGHVVDRTLLHRTDVYPALWVDVRNWISFRRGEYPPDVATAFWTYLDFLVETDGLHPNSDPIDVLRGPLRCYGLDAEGIPLPEGAPRQVSCTCHVRYRGPSHGELTGRDHVVRRRAGGAEQQGGQRGVR